VWYPRVFDRRAYPAWVEAGRPTAVETAREIARQALATHTPSPLPSATLDTLRGIVAQADARAGLPRQDSQSDHRIGATNRG
jgi:trimethylamine:corrinoid methyltransferase-like protein